MLRDYYRILHEVSVNASGGNHDNSAKTYMRGENESTVTGTGQDQTGAELGGIIEMDPSSEYLLTCNLVTRQRTGMEVSVCLLIDLGMVFKQTLSLVNLLWNLRSKFLLLFCYIKIGISLGILEEFHRNFLFLI